MTNFPLSFAVGLDEGGTVKEFLVNPDARLLPALFFLEQGERFTGWWHFDQ
jgi:hypothetical protein